MQLSEIYSIQLSLFKVILISDDKVSSIETSASLQQKLSFSVHGDVVLRHWALLRIVVVTSFCRLR